MEFKNFLIQQYSLSESSAEDYVGRLNGILSKGMYNGEISMTPSLKSAIEKEYSNSVNHYILALERYIKSRVLINHNYAKNLHSKIVGIHQSL